MPTYRDLYDKLATLSQEQLDSEIKVIPVGYTDNDAAALLRYDILPQVLELGKASRDLYHYAPSEEEDWIEPGITDFSESEVQEMGIAEDEDYTLVCKKGEVIFRIKDNLAIAPSEASNVGNIDTSILHF